VVLNTTRAPQIVLNRLMVASSMAAADARAAAFAQLYPRPFQSMRAHVSGFRSVVIVDENLVDVPRLGYAASASNPADSVGE